MKGNLHRTEKQCDICEQKFSNKSNLVKHKIKLHLNTVMSFHCEHCDQQFSTKWNFIRHNKKHMNNENTDNIDWYKCQHCEKTFANIRDILSHEKKHERMTYP